VGGGGEKPKRDFFLFGKKKNIYPETKVSKTPLWGEVKSKSDFFLFRTKKEKTEKSVRYKNFLCGQRIFSEILARARAK